MVGILFLSVFSPLFLVCFSPAWNAGCIYDTWVVLRGRSCIVGLAGGVGLVRAVRTCRALSAA